MGASAGGCCVAVQRWCWCCAIINSRDRAAWPSFTEAPRMLGSHYLPAPLHGSTPDLLAPYPLPSPGLSRVTCVGILPSGAVSGPSNKGGFATRNDA